MQKLNSSLVHSGALRAASETHDGFGLSLLDLLGRKQAAEAKVAASESDRDTCSQYISTLLAENQELMDGNRRLRAERDKAGAHSSLVSSSLPQQRTLDGRAVNAVTSPYFLYPALHLKHKEEGISEFDASRTIGKHLCDAATAMRGDS